MLVFDKCEVSVNGTGILAETAQISTQNSLQEVRSLGRKGVVGLSPNGALNGSFSFSYVVDTHREPVFAIAKGLRGSQENNSFPPAQLVIGGITGMGYLDSYGIKSTPNGLTKANATFQIYTSTTGSFTNAPQTYNATDIGLSGLNNSWTVFFADNQSVAARPILSFEYQLKANWQPIFTVGSFEPSQVQMLGGEESAQITHEDFQAAAFSGSAVIDFENQPVFRPSWTELSFLSNSNLKTSLTVDLSDAIVRTTQGSINTNSVATADTSISRFF